MTSFSYSHQISDENNENALYPHFIFSNRGLQHDDNFKTAGKSTVITRSNHEIPVFLLAKFGARLRVHMTIFMIKDYYHAT
jgi:hypothetical protein